ncbi:MAG: hypothetical protein ACLR0U_16030 [Enterocloster clostridioformis]
METYGGMYQVFMVKIDGGSGQVSRSGLEVMQGENKGYIQQLPGPGLP